jgi:osmotically-inducible protein OsmY
MNDPWDDERRQSGFVVTASGLRVPVAAQNRVAGWAPAAQARSGAGGAEANYRGVGPKGYQRTDQHVRDQICERLLLDPYLDASRIVVRVSKGKAKLTGSVPSERMRESAIAAAMNVSGDAVDAKLQVTGSAGVPSGQRRPARSRKPRRGRGGGR